MTSFVRPRIALIAAVAKIDQAIGCQGRLLWHIPEDLKHFKAMTLGKRVVMGRKTWDSLGKALPGRENVVVTRQRSLGLIGATTVSTIDNAIWLPNSTDPIFIIGGAEIYAATLGIADDLYLTEIDGLTVPYADCFFPAWNRAEFREVTRETHHSRDSPEGPFSFSFVHYVRV